jgi:hypothetical protein
MLDSENRLLISLVAKDGQWSVRLRTYRRSERGGRQTWLPTNQLVFVPLEVVASLQTLLTQAQTLLTQAATARAVGR